MTFLKKIRHFLCLGFLKAILTVFTVLPRPAVHTDAGIPRDLIAARAAVMAGHVSTVVNI